MNRQVDKKTIIIAVLAIALFISITYIVLGKYQENQTQKQIAVYQQGAGAGYQQAITQLLQQVLTCQQVPITFNNQTINVIAVECLQK